MKELKIDPELEDLVVGLRLNLVHVHTPYLD